MRIVRIYQQGKFKEGVEINLDEQAVKHVNTVLRMQKDQQLTLFSENFEYNAIITIANKKEVRVLINNVKFVNRESPRNIHLVQAIAKGERMEVIIQKAVELGVRTITPIITERTIVKLDKTRMLKKINHWQAIAIAACEQCGRNVIPEIHAIKTFEEFMNEEQQGHKFILSLENAKSCKELEFQDNASIFIIIGPEGGFTDSELKFAEGKKFQAISLGPRVLRTETAAICAVTLFQAFAGDLCYN